MNSDISGKAFKNVSGSSLQITDVGVFEIRPDGMVSTADYPLLEKSTQFRRFITLSYLLEDPSQGRRISVDNPVTIHSLQAKMSDDDMSKLADEVAKRLEGVLANRTQESTVPIPRMTPTEAPRTKKIDRGEDERAQIINHVIKNSMPTVEQFGDVEENPGETIPDVEEMVQRIQNMGGPPPDSPTH